MKYILFSCANLTDASLIEVCLDSMSLLNASLADMSLDFAVLCGVNLIGAFMRDSDLIETIWQSILCPEHPMNPGPLPCMAGSLNLV